MMGRSDKDTSVRLPMFDGQDAKWHTWKVKLLAYTCYKNFQGILNGDKLPRGEKDQKGDTIVLSDADERLIRRSNTVAYASLIMACQSGPFRHVDNTRSAKFPNGNAKEAWDKLISMYESGNMANIIALSHQWMKCTLGENKNPDSWYVELDCTWE